jgi:hypothetical protein
MNYLALIFYLASTFIICAIMLYCCRIFFRQKNPHKDRRLADDRAKEPRRYVSKDLNTNLIEDAQTDYYNAQDYDDANSLEANRE